MVDQKGFFSDSYKAKAIYEAYDFHYISQKALKDLCDDIDNLLEECKCYEETVNVKRTVERDFERKLMLKDEETKTKLEDEKTLSKGQLGIKEKELKFKDLLMSVKTNVG